MALMFLLGACGEANTAKEAVEGFVAGLKKHDYRAAMKYVYERDSMTFAGNTEMIMNNVCDSMNMNIVSDNASSVTVSVTTIDLRQVYADAVKAVINEYYNKALSGETVTDGELRAAIETKAAELSGNGKAATITSQVDLTMRTDNGKWFIELDANAYNVFTGYMTSANDMMTDGEILTYGN